jgi:hypothetical protein
LRTAAGLAAADILAAGASADLAAGIFPAFSAFSGGRFAGGRHFGDFGGRFDHGRFGRFGRFGRGFGFGGYGDYGYDGYGYDSCYVFTPSGYVWVCY